VARAARRQAIGLLPEILAGSTLETVSQPI
jgi:hypothetical protein